MTKKEKKPTNERKRQEHETGNDTVKQKLIKIKKIVEEQKKENESSRKKFVEMLNSCNNRLF